MIGGTRRWRTGAYQLSKRPAWQTAGRACGMCVASAARRQTMRWGARPLSCGAPSSSTLAGMEAQSSCSRPIARPAGTGAAPRSTGGVAVIRSTCWRPRVLAKTAQCALPRPRHRRCMRRELADGWLRQPRVFCNQKRGPREPLNAERARAPARAHVSAMCSPFIPPPCGTHQASSHLPVLRHPLPCHGLRSMVGKHTCTLS